MVAIANRPISLASKVRRRSWGAWRRRRTICCARSLSLFPAWASALLHPHTHARLWFAMGLTCHHRQHVLAHSTRHLDAIQWPRDRAAVYAATGFVASPSPLPFVPDPRLGVVGMHVRHGDKTQEEAVKVGFDRYTDALQRLRASRGWDGVVVVLATDSPSVLALASTYAYHCSPLWPGSSG